MRISEFLIELLRLMKKNMIDKMRKIGIRKSNLQKNS